MTRSLAALCCVCSFGMPAAAQNFLEGVVSINVNMTKEETCIASLYGMAMGITVAGRLPANGSTPMP